MTAKNVEEQPVVSSSSSNNIESPQDKERATHKQESPDKPFSVYTHREKWIIIVMAGIAATFRCAHQAHQYGTLFIDGISLLVR